MIPDTEEHTEAVALVLSAEEREQLRLLILESLPRGYRPLSPLFRPELDEEGAA